VGSKEGDDDDDDDDPGSTGGSGSDDDKRQGLSEYEKNRLRKIERNKRKLKSLGLDDAFPKATKKANTKRSGKKSMKTRDNPTRRSTRIGKINRNTATTTAASRDNDGSTDGEDNFPDNHETDNSDKFGGGEAFDGLFDEDEDDESDFVMKGKEDSDEDDEEESESESENEKVSCFQVYEVTSYMCKYFI